MQTTEDFSLIFEDACYPQELVDRINMLLCDWELDAMEMWTEICRAEHYLYSHKDNPDFRYELYQLSLETAPREVLLDLIMRKRIRGYKELLANFGFSIPETYR